MSYSSGLVIRIRSFFLLLKPTLSEVKEAAAPLRFKCRQTYCWTAAAEDIWFSGQLSSFWSVQLMHSCLSSRRRVSEGSGFYPLRRALSHDVYPCLCVVIYSIKLCHIIWKNIYHLLPNIYYSEDSNKTQKKRQEVEEEEERLMVYVGAVTVWWHHFMYFFSFLKSI